MKKVLTAKEMREVDYLTTEKYGIPSLLLMEAAARAVARTITERLGNSVAGKSFLILCGKGNNGGDGAALARLLLTQSAKVRVLLFGDIEETKGDAKTNFEILSRLEKDSHFHFEQIKIKREDFAFNWEHPIYQRIITDVDCIIDAVFGTGLSEPIKEPLSDLLKNFYQNIASRSNKPLVISVDLPSGLNADKPEAKGFFVNPDITVTFTAPKLANILPPVARYNGKLIIEDIGSPQKLVDESHSQLFLIEKQDAQNWLKKTRFAADSHKTARGRALIIAGSRNMSGAAVLAANAAIKTGAGLIQAAVPKSIRTSVTAHADAEVLVAALPETKRGAVSAAALEVVQKLIKKVDVVCIGCGLTSDDDATKKFVREFVTKCKLPIVVDADGLNALAPFDLKKTNDSPLILTPHIGEMRRLLGVDYKFDFIERISIVREFAARHNVYLVLKGERNLIAAPNNQVIVSAAVAPAIGKAGAGDTLSGILTGFLAQSAAFDVDILETIAAAVYVAGLAGDFAVQKFGPHATTASDIKDCLRNAFQSLED
jgi:hydroxyethylthiazole kinase-like uncharacterized protein yjeF